MQMNILIPLLGQQWAIYWVKHWAIIEDTTNKRGKSQWNSPFHERVELRKAQRSMRTKLKLIPGKNDKILNLWRSPDCIPCVLCFCFGFLGRAERWSRRKTGRLNNCRVIVGYSGVNKCPFPGLVASPYLPSLLYRCDNVSWCLIHVSNCASMKQWPALQSTAWEQ